MPTGINGLNKIIMKHECFESHPFDSISDEEKLYQKSKNLSRNNYLYEIIKKYDIHYAWAVLSIMS